MISACLPFNFDECFFSSLNQSSLALLSQDLVEEASLSVNTSQRSKTSSKSKKSYNSTPPNFSWKCNGAGIRTPPPKHGSPRSRSCTPIMFSNSRGMQKPPPIEKRLECTLEELCYGCQKKIKIIREVLTYTGGKVQEEEMLTINVKPGWKKGTKITFEGKGNERPGSYREDIIFIISEKRHKLFRREGDDLDLGLEIPLEKALTGCTVSVPLLGGKKMSLTVEDIVYPGYETIVKGQGMPISKEPGKRGNLRITFLVAFPKQLTDDQRSEVFSILQDCC
ncbi:protein psi1-like [Senna tora]|uniref:Protein psi1-like n=1 Tax=Senna tora TaxID=362788 RepID=A0A834T9P9_9FABA|nr:protein psi1-like [Senna tora]